MSMGSLLQLIIFELGKTFLIKPIYLKFSGALSIKTLSEESIFDILEIYSSCIISSKFVKSLFLIEVNFGLFKISLSIILDKKESSPPPKTFE